MLLCQDLTMKSDVTQERQRKRGRSWGDLNANKNALTKRFSASSVSASSQAEEVNDSQEATPKR